MNSIYAEVHPETGQLVVISAVPPDIMGPPRPIVPGNHVLLIGEGVDVPLSAGKFYDFEQEAVVERPSMPIEISKTIIAADAADQAIVSGIPDGASIYLDGEEMSGFASSSLELSSSMPATYRLLVECWPYLPFEAEIAAQ